jgi:hypothetical protein
MSIALQGALWRPGLPPGVYEDAPTVARRPRVRLDVAAFVGLAERGPVNTPVAVDDLRAFAAVFGNPLPGLQLPQAVRLFFANGGRRCVVVRCLDHREVRTARLELPEVKAVRRTATGWSRRRVRIAARNPGAWGNALAMQLRVVARPAPLRRDGGVGLRVADRRIQAGSTLRLAGARAPGGAVPRPRLFRVAEVVEMAGGERELRLDPAPVTRFLDAELLRSAVELTLELSVYLEGRLVERWEDSALHPDHPRYLPRLIGRRAASEALRPPPQGHPDGEDAGAEADRLWGGQGEPWGSEYLRPSAMVTDTWLHPSNALLAAPDGLRQTATGMRPSHWGRDSDRTTSRRHFFVPTEMDADHVAEDSDHRLIPYGDRPGALDALATWDQAFPQEPVALVALPDLLHPSAPEPQRERSRPPEETPCFLPECARASPAETTRHALAYPLLGFEGADLRHWQSALIAHCEGQGGRIAVLDLPPGLRAGELVEWRRALASDRAALYAPWLRVDAAGVARDTPPCGAACGIVARVERERGVWAAPANRPVLGAFARADAEGLPDPGFLHEERVDEVRLTERGLMLLGSRTTSFDPDWTHISVRRLVDWLKLQLALDLAWAPFEPNDRTLWTAMAGVARRRLAALFDAGALAGRTAAESWFVRCDEETNTPVDRDAGRVVMLIGLAPAAPAELIVFRLVRHGAGEPGIEVL